MANQEIHTPKDYSDALRKLLTTDPVHADTFNPLFERLINNDAYLKAFIEGILKASTGHKHSGVDDDGAKIPFANIDVPPAMGSIVTATQLQSHVNTRNPHGTRPTDIGSPTTEEFNLHVNSGASLSTKGHVQLTSVTNSTDETKAATPKAIKTVYDIANEKYTKPSDGIPKTDLSSGLLSELYPNKFIAKIEFDLTDAAHKVVNINDEWRRIEYSIINNSTINGNASGEIRLYPDENKIFARYSRGGGGSQRGSLCGMGEVRSTFTGNPIVYLSDLSGIDGSYTSIGLSEVNLANKTITIRGFSAQNRTSAYIELYVFK